jgi:hypothetical protein
MVFLHEKRNQHHSSDITCNGSKLNANKTCFRKMKKGSKMTIQAGGIHQIFKEQHN